MLKKNSYLAAAKLFDLATERPGGFSLVDSMQTYMLSVEYRELEKRSVQEPQQSHIAFMNAMRAIIKQHCGQTARVFRLGTQLDIDDPTPTDTSADEQHEQAAYTTYFKSSNGFQIGVKLAITAKEVLLDVWTVGQLPTDHERRYLFKLIYGSQGQLILAEQKYKTFGDDGIQNAVMRCLVILKEHTFNDHQYKSICAEMDRLGFINETHEEPVSSRNEEQRYVAIEKGSEYELGDWLLNSKLFGVFELGEERLVYNFWMNLNTGRIMSGVPKEGTYQRIVKAV